MTNNVKKTSELPTTNSASGSDRVVILKDPAGTPSTRTISFNNLANTVYEKILVPNTVVVSNVITIASQGTSAVEFFTFNSNVYSAVDMDIYARDYVTGEARITKVFYIANATSADSNYIEVGIGSPSPIHFDTTPTINTTSKIVSCYFRRDTSSTNNIQIRYVAVQHKV